jgi:biotin transport system ATP-binding protein
MSATTGIRLDDVSVRIDILRDVTLDLSEHRIGLIGANGSGKSTLARLLNGLVLPSTGTVRTCGLDVERQGPAVRRLVGFLFADPDTQIVMPTPVEDVELSLRRLDLAPADRHAAALAALAEVGLDHLAHTSVHALSGGQRQLLALTSVLATEPQVIVADEPTTLLDLRNALAVRRRFRALPQQMVVATHDLDLLSNFDRVLVLQDGRVVVDAAPAEAIAWYRSSMQDETDDVQAGDGLR